MFRLALLLGRTVRELELTLDARELAEWEAYHRLEPLPDHHWDAAQVCRVMADSWSGKEHSIDQFLPVVRSAEEPDDEDNGSLQFARFQAIIGRQHKG